jgi:hypothetical protein
MRVMRRISPVFARLDAPAKRYAAQSSAGASLSRRRSTQIPGKPINRSNESLPSIAPQPAGRPIGVAVLLALGIGVWIATGGGRGIGGVRWAIILCSAAMAFFPAVASGIESLLTKIRHPSSRAAGLASVVIAAVAAGYFILTAVLQDRDLFPKTHDDCSYLIQMQMLARGRLWMPALPLADFFDSFYLIVRPVYASQYFPGTALLYVPMIWLHLPTWVMPVMAAGAVVGLTYRILTELVDGAAGALGALWIASLSEFRLASILLMSQVPALLLALVMVWGWLRWRRKRAAGWMVVIGVAAGWAAITRPVDALCFAIPIGIATAVDLLKFPFRKWVAIACLIVVGAAPFLAIQLVFNKGVTGHLFETPFRMYLDRDAPGTQFGFPAFDPRAHPQSIVPQKQEYYSNWVTPFIAEHRPGQLLRSWVNKWFPMIVDTTMPARVMLPLAAVGLLGLGGRRRWVLWGTVPAFITLYAFYTVFLEHYAIILMPAVAMVCLLSVGAIGQALPRALRPSASAALTVLIAVACLTSFWEINRMIAPPGKQVDDEPIRSAMLRDFNQKIPYASDLQKPAVFLFRYHKGDNFFEEPVYNTDVAWPDDAEIIRAHDLGPQRDRQIVEYYAGRTPVRHFYLFDAKAPVTIIDLGPTDHPAQILQNLDEAESTTNGNSKRN